MALNSTGRTSPDPADLPTFSGRPTFKTLSGPLKLYRFGSEDGRWWYGESLIEEIKSDFFEETLGRQGGRHPAGGILASARNDLAVSNEWNKFVWLCTMKLRPGDAVDCWTGPTAPQPEWRSKPDGRILHGGLEQFLIYDVKLLPPGLITRQPVTAFWKELSRKVAKF